MKRKALESALIDLDQQADSYLDSGFPDPPIESKLSSESPQNPSKHSG